MGSNFNILDDIHNFYIELMKKRMYGPSYLVLPQREFKRLEQEIRLKLNLGVVSLGYIAPSEHAIYVRTVSQKVKITPEEK